MKILVTNDDGIDAPGLQALVDVARNFGEPVVAAPADQHSQQGHRLTTGAPIAVDLLGSNWYRIAGTPADCVRLGLLELAPDAAWVFAGINSGGNLGADVYCSGTVAAVREAALLGWPGVAVSQYIVRSRLLNWAAAARLADAALRLVLDQAHHPRQHWNINLPHLEDPSASASCQVCPVDPSPFDVRYERRDGAYVYCGEYHGRPRVQGSDVDVCFGGAVAISKLSL